MSEVKICQSCAMPMDEANLFGTQADGTPCEDYCRYCYTGGQFTKEETMEEMAESCIPFLLEDHVYPDEASARTGMLQLLPGLKRWARS